MEDGDTPEEDTLWMGLTAMPGRLEEDVDIEYDSVNGDSRNIMKHAERHRVINPGMGMDSSYIQARQWNHSGREHYEDDVISLDSLGFGVDSDTSSMNERHKSKRALSGARREREPEEQEASSDTYSLVQRGKRSVQQQQQQQHQQQGFFSLVSRDRKHVSEEHSASRAPKRQARSTFGSDTPHAFAVDLSIGAG